MKIYHNPRCRKSRETLEIIRNQGTEPEIVEYLNNVPTSQELAELLEKLGMEATQLLRKGEAIFKEKFKGKTFSNAEWIDIMVQNPKLIERPIVVQGNKAVIGRPPEKVLECFNFVLMHSNPPRKWTFSRIYAAIMRRIVRFYLTLFPFEFWQKWGYHVLPVHYYSQIPNTAELPESLWEGPAEMPGVNLREAEQVDLLTELSAFKAEYDAFPKHPTDKPYVFYTEQRTFNCVDAQSLYAMVRKIKPKRMIEIGSGFSTFISAQALRKNAEENPGDVCKFTAIEPYPNPIVAAGFPGLTELKQAKAQEVPPEYFSDLEAGDILFIDSTHTLKIGGDVLHEILEILPRLKKGVIVHIHDVFLPYQYPRSWAMKYKWFWAEQYLLQAFLYDNATFEVMWLSYFMHRKHPEKLSAAMKGYEPEEEYMGSCWLRKVK